jgi:hypothetical protein
LDGDLFGLVFGDGTIAAFGGGILLGGFGGFEVIIVRGGFI